MFVPIDEPIQMPVAPSPIFKPAHSQVRSRLTNRQCRRTEAAPECPCPRRPPAAMLCAASVTKRLAATKELCSQYDRCVGIFADLSKNSLAI